MEIRNTHTVTALRLSEDQINYSKKERTELDKAYEYNKEASTYLNRYEAKEAEDFYESANAHVEDVEAAAKLAEKLSINITNFGEKAFAAQANQNKEIVADLLK